MSKQSAMMMGLSHESKRSGPSSSTHHITYHYAKAFHTNKNQANNLIQTFVKDRLQHHEGRVALVFNTAEVRGLTEVEGGHSDFSSRAPRSCD